MSEWKKDDWSKRIFRYEDAGWPVEIDHWTLLKRLVAHPLWACLKSGGEGKVTMEECLAMTASVLDLHASALGKVWDVHQAMMAALFGEPPSPSP